MSNNTVSIEGPVVLKDQPVYLQNEIAWWGTISDMPIVFAGKIGRDVEKAISSLGIRFLARVQVGKLVSYPGRTYILAKKASLWPVMDGQVDVGDPKANSSFVTLDGYLRDARDPTTVQIGGAFWPQIMATLFTDKAYAGGAHNVALTGNAAIFYEKWHPSYPDGFHATIQGRLENDNGLIIARTFYLRPSARLRTDELRID